MTMENKVLLYTAVLRPILSYGSPVWGYAAKSNLKTLEICQNKTIRMIVHVNMYMRNSDIYKALKLPTFKRGPKVTPLRTPTGPNSPTPTQNCSRLQLLAKEVDQYSTFVRGQQFIIVTLKTCGVNDTKNPYVKELLNSLCEFTDLHHQAETAENLTTELASTNNQNIVIAPPPTENLLNAPTPKSNAPKPNYVPPLIMLKVTKTYKQQMKVITDKLTTTNEKYSPDVILVQETHLRPKHNININNYKHYRNDRIVEGQAYGGTLILIKKSIPPSHTPTPQLYHVEATLVTLNSPNLDPIIITSIYIPPHSDSYLFTLDLETILQVNIHCVILTPHTIRGIAPTIRPEELS
ncbi:putative RNA-directed DNA polymerase from transposon X-element [Trichonephila clavipes]|nr:putative RNA-directed DNA polymerase from transposon X-element [Trichonephila clavipes]